MSKLQVRWTITACAMVLVTLACCAESMAVVAYLFPFPVSKRYNVGDYYLFVMFAVMVYPAIRCARALRRLTPTRTGIFHDVPEALLVLAVVAIPVAWFPKYVAPVLGDFTQLFTFALLWFAPLTSLGFVAAGARVDFADIAGDERKPGAMIITVIYHLGGGAGIAFARLVFKDSPALKDSPGGMPRLLRVIAVIAVVVGFARWLTFPTLTATPPDTAAPFRTFSTTK